MNKAICPLCEEKLFHIEKAHAKANSTHIYKCEACPFIGFEYYNKKDLEALTNSIR